MNSRLSKQVFCVLAVHSFVLSGCAPSNDFPTRLESELKKEKGTVVKLSELTDFEWTTVYVYGPYQPIEEINKKHKTNLKDEYHLNHVPEGDCLFLFENQGKTVSIITIPRYKGGCFEILEPGVYSKQNAIFEVQKKQESMQPQLTLRSNLRVEPTR
jgi:hypothetical protein